MTTTPRALQSTMQALQLDALGDPGNLHFNTWPIPRVNPGVIRIRVHAVGLSSGEDRIIAGTHPVSSRLPLPHVPGIDASGVVDAVGAGVPDVAPGDEVFGSVGLMSFGGAAAEFAILEHWAARPGAFDRFEASAAGTSVETATRALDRLDLRPGMTLLIDGGSGAVGTVAIQLAILRGAHVIATASPRNHALVESLGAHAIAYGEDLADRVRPLVSASMVHRALDVAGRGSVPSLVRLTGNPESVITIADPHAAAAGVRMSTSFSGEANGWAGLNTAAALAEKGEFRVPVATVFPRSEAGAAFRAASDPDRSGKIVLDMSS